MNGGIHKRWLLVALVAGGQLLVLLAGSVWMVHWLQGTITQIVRQRVMASNSQFALQMAEMINQLQLHDITPGSGDWERLQEVVERIELPNEGFVSIISADDGRVLNHPQLRTDPAIRESFLGKQTLYGEDASRTLLESANASRVQGGWLDMPDGTHIVAVHDLPELKAKLIAHQRERGVQVVIDEFARRARVTVISLMLIVVLLSTLVTTAIMRQYDNRLASINANLEKLVEQRSRAMLKSRGAVIFGLAKLAESRDDQTGEHLERIQKYVLILASQLARTHPEVSEEMIETLVETSSLHDIGKVGVPDSVLLSPNRLSEEERSIIQRHTTIGGDTLLALKRRWGDDPFLVTACEIAFAHHERWDGGGYPFGLKGADIPVSARIVAVADVYDALTSERTYKKAMTHEEAATFIESGSGSHFDPEVVRAFAICQTQFRNVLNGRENGEARGDHVT